MSYEYLDEKNKKILELETRKSIYELVKRYSGCHFRELERKSKLSTGILKYHLDFLAKHNLIKQEKDGNNLRYFLSDIQIENRKLLSFLRQESIRKIILFMLANKDCHHEDIVRFVKLSASTVSWHLKKLLRNNVITQIKEGRKTIYKLLINEEEIVKLLIYYKESFLDSLVNKTIEMWNIK